MNRFAQSKKSTSGEPKTLGILLQILNELVDTLHLTRDPDVLRTMWFTLVTANTMICLA